MNQYEQWQERERRYVSHALELLGHVPLQYDMGPLLSVIRQADALGFDVVKRADALCSFQPRASVNRGEAPR